MRIVISAFTAGLLALGACTPQTKVPEISSAAELAEIEKQKELALREMVETEQRLHAIGHRILQGAVSLCEDRRYDIGVMLWSETSVKEEWQSVAKSAYGLDRQVVVAAVAPTSPAADAGLEPGDEFRRIGAWAVPQDMDDPAKLGGKLRELIKDGAPADLIVLRDGARQALTVTPREVCDYTVALRDDAQVNAFADGDNVIVTKGMMDFARSDQEIAVVVGHELAHNAMGHIDSKTVNKVVGAAPGLVLDILLAVVGVNTQGQFMKLGMAAGGAAFSVEFEQEADYVGLYAMALSGYELEGAPDLWRRMATKDPKKITFRGSHPTTPERFIALEETVEEIQLKIADGRPLTPEMKDDDEEGGGVVVQTDSPDRDGAAFAQ